MDLTNPELTIIVEVIKAVCCISVLKDYTLYRKYNVQEVVKEDAPKPDGATVKMDTNTAGQTKTNSAGEDDKEEKEDEGGEVKNVADDKKEVDNGEGGGE